jgi:hypothetical protein
MVSFSFGGTETCADAGCGVNAADLILIVTGCCGKEGG